HVDGAEASVAHQRGQPGRAGLVPPEGDRVSRVFHQVLDALVALPVEEIERGVTLVEWGAHVLADQDHLAISIDRGRDDDVRVVTLPAALAPAVARVHK
ncbi:MAG: hypothetical protein EBU85_07610, partial [Actinobacteria bacterium]|nr:hypothetical protein [Actinomycetota bacterium]